MLVSELFAGSGEVVVVGISGSGRAERVGIGSSSVMSVEISRMVFSFRRVGVRGGCGLGGDDILKETAWGTEGNECW